MSYYYNYYLGYKKDGKIYPAGLFNEKGSIYPVLSRSRSYASDLYCRFVRVSDELMTDELKKYFEYVDYRDEKHIDVKYLPLSKLPNRPYIKRGYVLISEVNNYEKNIEENEGDPDFFSEILTPTSYIAKVLNELVFDSKTEENSDSDKDVDEEYRDSSHKAMDYTYYAFPDYYCEEYECDVIRRFAGAYDNFNFTKDYDELVILETEG